MWLVQGELMKYMARRRRKKKLSPFTVVGVIVLCCVLCGTFTYKTITLKAESAKYSAQISELKKEKKKLNEQKAEIKDYESYAKTILKRWLAISWVLYILMRLSLNQTTNNKKSFTEM